MPKSIKKTSPPTPRRRAPVGSTSGEGKPSGAKPRIIKHIECVGENEFTLELSWDDAAAVGGELSFEIVASHSIVDKPESRRSLSASVALRRDKVGAPVLEIKVGGIKIEKNLDELFDETQAEEVVKEVIDAIPSMVFGAGEPIIGCLIRSGLSVIVSQVIHCKNLTMDLEW